jgi:hypothetical protein
MVEGVKTSMLILFCKYDSISFASAGRSFTQRLESKIPLHLKGWREATG